GEDRVHGDQAHGAVIAVVVRPPERVLGDHTVGPVLPYQAYDLAAQLGRILHATIGLAQELHGLQAEHFGRVELLLLPRCSYLGRNGLGVIGALVAAGSEDVDHFRTHAHPLGDAAGATEVGIVGVGGDHHDAGRYGCVSLRRGLVR